VLAAYYVLAYLGFAAPYAVDGLNLVAGKLGTFAVLAGTAAALAGLMWLRGARSAPVARADRYRTQSAYSRTAAGAYDCAAASRVSRTASATPPSQAGP
jgi:hypothetical protein